MIALNVVWVLEKSIWGLNDVVNVRMSLLISVWLG